MPSSNKLSSIAVSMLLGVSGCVVGPNYAPPPASKTVAFTNASMDQLQHAGTQVDGSQAEPDAWWTLLQSPQLDGAIRQALKANHSMIAARATLEQAKALDVVSDAQRYPSAQLSGGAGRNQFGAAFLGPAVFPAFTFYNIGPSVSYTFDFSGGIRRTIEQQHAETEYEQHELDASALAVSGNLALQAVAAAAARAQIDNVQALLEDDRKDLQLVQSAFDAGSGTRVDVLTAQSQLANDQTQLPPLRRDLSTATHALALLVGEAPADWSPPDFKLEDFTIPASLPVSVPSELAHRRPDILAAEAQVHAANAAIGVATANLYPSLSISANASLQSTKLRDLFESASSAWGYSASLTAPLFNHGSLRAKQRAALETMHASLANYQQVLLSSFAQVADALEALDHDQELIDSEQGAVTVAADSLELTRESYSAGNSGVLQVLDAQRQNQQARLGLVRAQSQRLQDIVQLLMALGGQVPQS
ncbi:MAG TPA: efflux transporter outer membrane subunit [Steroidobacteraceae bacterium]|jgi:NodT family efflux transporter outer membrane factor (OMF) lipoprotein|nr:efflux transporter outer membrane subunit [Steroidobacteraceae bacterium]